MVPNAGEDAGEVDHPYTAHGNVKWHHRIPRLSEAPREVP